MITRVKGYKQMGEIWRNMLFKTDGKTLQTLEN